MSFSKKKLRKMLISLALAATGGAALGLLNYLQTIQINDPLLAQMVVVAVPFVINTVRELFKLEPHDTK